ncbi:MAG TPA: hypothetical protein PKC30_05840 [Saprospiraceae bacterium]|nr:hypothetical protein [Saprospiraceae bacterium]
MMCKPHYIFIIFILVLCQWSCDKDPGQKDLILVPDEFILNLGQEVTSQGPAPSFQFRTINLVDCKMKDLLIFYSPVGNRLIVYLDGIIENEECVGEDRLLNKDVFSYLPFGTFQVEIKIKNIIENSGQLRINDSSFHLEMDSSHGFRLDRAEVNRIPSNHIWGNIECIGPCADNLIEQFEEVLENYITLSEVLTDGDYDLFFIAGHKIQLKDHPKNIRNKQFIYQMQGDMNELRDRINQFKLTHPELKMSITTSQGRFI